MDIQRHKISGLLLTIAISIGLSACASFENGQKPLISTDTDISNAASSDINVNDTNTTEAKLPACNFDPNGRELKEASYKNYSTAANKHIIVINNEVKKRRSKKDDGELVNYDDQFKAVMKGYLEWHNESKTKNNKLMLLFNGGLNSAKKVKNAAVTQIECIKKDNIYPVYMVWDSGIGTTYFEQSAYIRNGLLNKHPSPTTPLYIASDILSSIARAPQVMINELSRFIDSVVVSDPKDYSLKNDGKYIGSHDEGHKGKCRSAENRINIKLCLPFQGGGENPSLDNSPPLDEELVFGVVRFGVATPVRVTSLGLIVESGKEAWNNMLRRTRNTVHHPGEFQLEFWNDDGRLDLDKKLSDSDIHKLYEEELKNNRDELMQKYKRGTGRFARFFHDLEACIDSSKCLTGKDITDDMSTMELTLVGHSMGAIVINELVPDFIDLPYRNIVFMAGATSIRDTKDALVPLLRKNNNLNFYNLMLHPKAEAREDSAFGFLPTGSLLEWIDEVLEKPKTVLDRTMGKWRNLREAQKVFPPDARDHMTFRIFGFDQRDWTKNLIDGQPIKSYVWPEPTTHGSFNDTNKQFWRTEFWGGPLM